MKFSFFLLALLSLFALAFSSPFTVRQEEDEGPDPSATPEDDEVCVSQSYLETLGHSAKDFVHKNGVVARAYCPGGQLPCGTEHHRVRFEGQDMNYKLLCETMVCERKMVVVNSVWSHLWEEKVHDGVVVTMFDHRYPEIGQKALHWGVRNVRRVFG